MIKLLEGGYYLVNGTTLIKDDQEAAKAVKSITGKETTSKEAAKETIAYGILKAIIPPAIWRSLRSDLTS